MADTDPFFTSGDGSAAEALMDVNPTIAIPAGGAFNIYNFIGTYEGIGVIRIRETDLNGAELVRLRFAADGLIQGDFRFKPLTYKGGASGRALVVTQEGDFSCSLLLSGE